MDRLAQGASPLAMNNAHLNNTSLKTSCEIIRHQLMDFRRLERVQIQHPINRQLDWVILIHLGNLRFYP